MLVIDAKAVDAATDWHRIVAAQRAGHLLGKPQLQDMLLQQPPNGLFVRAAWIEGLGAAVKGVTVFPGNVNRVPYVASINGSVLLFDRETGLVNAAIDGAAVTRWKTAGDSALGSDLLSCKDSRSHLMVGAGVMSEQLIRAHVAVRPSLERLTIWNRTRERAEAVAGRLGDLGRPVQVVTDLEPAVREADIISTATMTHEPLVKGAWLKEGTHLDLIGAYKMDMRETDDDSMRRGRVFVDYRGTTIGHIGEITTPIRTGVIREEDVLGDLYDLVPGAPGRLSDKDITVYKNGGGAHLDLMTSLAILEAVKAKGAA